MVHNRIELRSGPNESAWVCVLYRFLTGRGRETGSASGLVIVVERHPRGWGACGSAPYSRLARRKHVGSINSKIGSWWNELCNHQAKREGRSLASRFDMGY